MTCTDTQNVMIPARRWAEGILYNHRAERRPAEEMLAELGPEKWTEL
jgi:hypothetical protein